MLLGPPCCPAALSWRSSCQVKFLTEKECALGVSFYPDIAYNGEGGFAQGAFILRPLHNLVSSDLPARAVSARQALFMGPNPRLASRSGLGGCSLRFGRAAQAFSCTGFRPFPKQLQS